jgi:hypothetical protein
MNKPLKYNSLDVHKDGDTNVSRGIYFTHDRIHTRKEIKTVKISTHGRTCNISFFFALLLSLFSISECFILKRKIVHGGSYNCHHCLIQPPVTMVYKPNVVMKTSTCYVTALKAMEDDDNKTVESKLSNVGYTNVEIQRAKPKKEELNVHVNLLPDIDSESRKV